MKRVRNFITIMKSSFSLPLTTLLLPLFLGFTLFSGCARFRIEELSPSLVASLPVLPPQDPNPDHLLQAMERGRVPYNLPTRPALDDSLLYLSDPARQLVRILSRSSGELNLLLADQHIPALQNARSLPLGVPGWIAVDDEENLYIQSRIFDGEEEKPLEVPPERRIPGQLNTKEMSLLPSVILHLNKEGRLLQTLGQQGQGGDPFPVLYRMDAGDEGKLYVLYKNKEEKRVMALYRNGTLVHDTSAFDPATADEKRRFKVEIDNIVPFPTGENYMASVSFRNRNDYNLVYRKIFRLSPPFQEAKEVLLIDNPSDYFAWTHPGGGFYLMNSEGDGSRILFKIYSSDGEYLNNRLVNFPGLRAGWRETYLTLQGRIFSTRLNQGAYEIYEWK